ncbi:NAD(P)-binding domain-containing protein [Thalassotalea maritima]|uniref:NAD(P)-binding domain-containing protein n=1 Tax=Thalassotalea maritima TaxID=3242416 RepID=UPI0035291724
MINNKATHVAVIGAGWIGYPLAKHLIAKGMEVLATTTSATKVAQLNQQGIRACILNTPQQLPLALHQYPHWIICIPPGIRQGKSDYADKIQALVDFATSSNGRVKQLILLSSTAVYNGLAGVVTEHSALDTKDTKVALLHAAEQVVLNSSVTYKTILRLGGLFGYDRQPGRYFTHKAVPNPDSVINFIHQDDVIAILQQLLARYDTVANIVNGVCPHHPTRRDFYQKALLTLAHLTPEFAEQQEQQGKQVDSVYLADIYPQFQVADLFAYFDSKFAKEYRA